MFLRGIPHAPNQFSHAQRGAVTLLLCCVLLCPIIGVSSVTSLLYDSMISGVFDGVLRGLLGIKWVCVLSKYLLVSTTDSTVYLWLPFLFFWAVAGDNSSYHPKEGQGEMEGNSLR